MRPVETFARCRFPARPSHRSKKATRRVRTLAGDADIHADHASTSGITHNLLIYQLFLEFNEQSHQRALTDYVSIL